MGDADRKRVLAILVHGDAAFSGQGVVTETLNMSALRAYSCGGTIHLIVNNQIGFTTGPIDLFSSEYCTDNAKIVQAPIFHANGDFPESALRAARVAVDYQREFSGDAVLDIVCYRRWGHNEGDEPAYTQPTLYAKIRSHPTVRRLHAALHPPRLAHAQVGGDRRTVRRRAPRGTRELPCAGPPAAEPRGSDRLDLRRSGRLRPSRRS
jgi:2-oxoglutarate dehydrogenase E1 component